MIDIMSLNAQALIAFSLVMIVGLLTYIAFFKDSADQGSKKK
jgi:hypothetical protein